MTYVCERWSDTMWSIEKWEVIEPELWICLDNRSRWKEKNTRLEFWNIPIFKGQGKREDKEE